MGCTTMYRTSQAPLIADNRLLATQLRAGSLLRKALDYKPKPGEPDLDINHDLLQRTIHAIRAYQALLPQDHFQRHQHSAFLSEQTPPPPTIPRETPVSDQYRPSFPPRPPRLNRPYRAPFNNRTQTG